MSLDIQLIYLVAARLLVLILGATITVISFKAYRRMRSKTMLTISLAFVMITLGPLVEGVLFEFFNFNLVDAHTVESSIVLLGFITLIYALTRVRS